MYKVPRAVKFIASIVERRLSGAGGKGNGALWFKWVESSTFQDEESQRWLHSNVNVLNIDELHTHKWFDGKFCYMYLTITIHK